MTTLNRKDWIEIVGMISIVVTLIFVAVEIRHNTNAARSAVYQSIADQGMIVLAMPVENADLRAALKAVGPGGGTDEEKFLVHFYYGMAVRVSQNRYLQAELGVVDHDRMLFLGGRSRLFPSPGFRAYWEPRKHRFDEGYRDYVEKVLMDPENRLIAAPD